MHRVKFLGVFLFAGFLAACGGGGASSDSVDTSVKKTSILLTDQHEEEIVDRHGARITSAKEVWVTFSAVDLKPEVGTWITVFSGPPNKSVDLLTLHGTTDLIALVDLPPGQYEKARLSIESAYFVDGDGTRHDLIVPSNKITLKFSHDLAINKETNAEIVFDFVPGKSIHLVETGNGKFILRPVIHVKINGEPEATETAKVEGKIASVDCDHQSLTLSFRQGSPMTVDLTGAVIIEKDGASKKIDDGGEGGKQHEALSLAACRQLAEGQIVEVIGNIDDQGVLHASTVQIEEEDGSAHRIEFSGTLLEVDCDGKKIKVTFSGGDIWVALNSETKVFTSVDAPDPALDNCAALQGAVQKKIQIEGGIVSDQVLATRVTVVS